MYFRSSVFSFHLFCSISIASLLSYIFLVSFIKASEREMDGHWEWLDWRVGVGWWAARARRWDGKGRRVEHVGVGVAVCFACVEDIRFRSSASIYSLAFSYQ